MFDLDLGNICFCGIEMTDTLKAVIVLTKTMIFHIKSTFIYLN